MGKNGFGCKLKRGKFRVDGCGGWSGKPIRTCKGTLHPRELIIRSTLHVSCPRVIQNDISHAIAAKTVMSRKVLTD